MNQKLTGISSMATRLLLQELVDAYQRKAGIAVAIESVGGVDATKRIQAGEAFDIVVLASDAIDKLAAAGRVIEGSKVDIALSGVAIAVRAGATHSAIDSEEALKQAVRSAQTVGYSTGPSGVAVQKLFERWGIAGEIEARIVQAQPGVPVGSMIAEGKVELGFQQLSELLHVDGIDVLGPLPEAIRITTTFSAGVCSASSHPDDARRLLEFMSSAETAGAKRRQGMVPA